MFTTNKTNTNKANAVAVIINATKRDEVLIGDPTDI